MNRIATGAGESVCGASAGEDVGVGRAACSTAETFHEMSVDAPGGLSGAQTGRPIGVDS